MSGEEMGRHLGISGARGRGYVHRILQRADSLGPEPDSPESFLANERWGPRSLFRMKAGREWGPGRTPELFYSFERWDEDTPPFLALDFLETWDEVWDRPQAAAWDYYFK
jgi:hypothetical protein